MVARGVRNGFVEMVYTCWILLRWFCCHSFSFLSKEMKGVEAQDLNAGDLITKDYIGFCAMVDGEVLDVSGKEIWLDNEQEDLLDMKDTSIFNCFY